MANLAWAGAAISCGIVGILIGLAIAWRENRHG